MTEKKPLTEVGLKRKIKALGDGLDEGEKARITCALIGHSGITKMCFGYVYCARCDAQIGDTLGGSTDMKKRIVVGHRTREGEVCPDCLANFKEMDWEDTIFLPEKVEKELYEGLGLEPAAKKVAANRRKR